MLLQTKAKVARQVFSADSPLIVLSAHGANIPRGEPQPSGSGQGEGPLYRSSTSSFLSLRRAGTSVCFRKEEMILYAGHSNAVLPSVVDTS